MNNLLIIPNEFISLRLAIKYGHRAVTTEILPHLKPEDVVFRNPRRPKGKTALHYAASRDRSEIVSDLLSAGLVDVDQSDSAGRTPLLRAIQEDGTAKTVKVLLDHGANPTLHNPLHACAGKRDDYYDWLQTPQDVQEIAAELLAGGAGIEDRDQHGNTPIFHAVHGHHQVLQWFVENGADIHARNDAGETPLHHARGLEALEILLRAGAKINAVDSAGNTPLAAINSESNYLIRVRDELFKKYAANI